MLDGHDEMFFFYKFPKKKKKNRELRSGNSVGHTILRISDF